MRSLKNLSILLFILGFVITGQKSKAQSDNQPSSSLEKSLLWKVTGKGIKPSYLFGTIHMIAAKDYFWNENMDKAFDKCKKLVMEIDMSNQMAMAIEMMKLAPMNGDQSLEDLLSEEDYKTVSDYFLKESDAPEAKITFNMGKNWQPMLLQSLLYKEMIEGPVKMYEMELTAKAKANKMEMGGLETVSDQMAVFHKIPYKKQAEMLLESIINIKEGKQDNNEFAKMVEKYKEQDVDGMLVAMQDDIDEMENSDALIDDRNKDWIPKIKEMSKKASVFYAVGAGHLGGENGVIRLLRNAGYKVEAQ